jgi:cation diffusion facilitator family transporter
MRAKTDARNVVYAALGLNLAIAATKFIAAWFTGSAAMLSEAVHSLVDTINELLLLYGMHRAGKRPDRGHPFGYGRELYFWSFIVALLVFALGAGVALYEGISHLLARTPIEHVVVNYVVIVLSFGFEAASWQVAMKEFRAAKGDLGYFEAFQSSKDPTTFTVLFEDSAALVGLAIAFAGILGAQLLHLPELDGIASILIAIVLTVSSLFLARETKALLIGEPALPHVQDSILKIAEADPAIRKANGVLTVHLGPEQVVAALSAEFEDCLTTPQIEACVNRVEAAIKAAHPEITILFVKPQTPETWKARRDALGFDREPGQQ